MHVRANRRIHISRHERQCGVELTDIPTPLMAAGKTPSFVGRIRQDQAVDGKKGLSFFLTNDNLRKGAALNAVQLAEIIAQKHFADRL